MSPDVPPNLNLDAQTLEPLAELICGDGGPVYRQGHKLAPFFRSAGLECPDHDGSTRKWWTLTMLSEYATQPGALKRILLRLADPREYRGNAGETEAAIRDLNGILAIEGLEVWLDGITPRLRRVNPALRPATPPTPAPPVTRAVPDFAVFSDDEALIRILEERWREADRCVRADAHLSAIIMMGSLLEGALVAVAKARPADANRASTAPHDRDGKVKRYTEWTLNNLIEVAHECRWIEADVRDFAQALRDYRNLVHPWEQLQRQVTPDADTCEIAWSVVQAAMNDLAAASSDGGT
jgi:hypothetical protein